MKIELEEINKTIKSFGQSSKRLIEQKKLKSIGFKIALIAMTSATAISFFQNKNDKKETSLKDSNVKSYSYENKKEISNIEELNSIYNNSIELEKNIQTIKNEYEEVKEKINDDMLYSNEESRKKDPDIVNPDGPGGTDPDVINPDGPGETDPDVVNPDGPGGTDLDVVNPDGPGGTDLDVVNPDGPGETDPDVINPDGPGGTDLDVVNPDGPGGTDLDVVNPDGPGGTDPDIQIIEGIGCEQKSPSPEENLEIININKLEEEKASNDLRMETYNTENGVIQILIDSNGKILDVKAINDYEEEPSMVNTGRGTR